MNDSREDIIDETTNQEQNVETVPDTQEGLISWVKESFFHFGGFQ